jgi:murein DD-endopeptidase MepM/ murein hydrolase activator NlpD
MEGLAEERVAALLSDQDAALAAAEDSAERRLENLRAVLRLTGMRVEEAMDEGPLEDRRRHRRPVYSAGSSADLFSGADLEDPFNARVARIASRLVEAEQLETLLTAAPLAIPVDGPYRRTSNYGSRLDPFTGRLAFHAGADFCRLSQCTDCCTCAGPGRLRGLARGLWSHGRD